MDPGGLLREARRESGLSQRGLAAMTGVSKSVVAGIESGARDPRVGMLRSLLAACSRALELDSRPLDRASPRREINERIDELLEFYAMPVEQRWSTSLQAADSLGVLPVPVACYQEALGRATWSREPGPVHAMVGFAALAAWWPTPWELMTPAEPRLDPHPWWQVMEADARTPGRVLVVLVPRAIEELSVDWRRELGQLADELAVRDLQGRQRAAHWRRAEGEWRLNEIYLDQDERDERRRQGLQAVATEVARSALERRRAERAELPGVSP